MDFQIDKEYKEEQRISQEFAESLSVEDLFKRSDACSKLKYVRPIEKLFKHIVLEREDVLFFLGRRKITNKKIGGFHPFEAVCLLRTTKVVYSGSFKDFVKL